MSSHEIGHILVGMGTGLFAGDDLNPGFPPGDGVQIFLTFELPEELESPSGGN